MTPNEACRAEALWRRLERDIRNQVVIDRMKRLDRRARLMVLLYRLERRSLLIAGLLSIGIWVLFCFLRF